LYTKFFFSAAMYQLINISIIAIS